MPATSSATLGFNPRSPCGERLSLYKLFSRCGLFQPTLPLRGATCWRRRSLTAIEFQPTLPLRGATTRSCASVWTKTFQPTLPLRGATCSRDQARYARTVSTHAPLAGSDARQTAQQAPHLRRFNPRSPCGERREDLGHRPLRSRVSTHAPLAGSDAAPQPTWETGAVSTHAPLAGSDCPSARRRPRCICFNPRSPCGERPANIVIVYDWS